MYLNQLVQNKGIEAVSHLLLHVVELVVKVHMVVMPEDQVWRFTCTLVFTLFKFTQVLRLCAGLKVSGSIRSTKRDSSPASIYI